jgi:cardiolipin synthase A/B
MPAFLHWRMPYFNLRNHRKIMVVDGGRFTGGMNIREGHELRLDPKHPTPDTHFRVTGPVVGGAGGVRRRLELRYRRPARR